ncbi:MAG: ATP-binding protein [Clostridiales bacterium]|nr:ATP-binding protein [Clostridiales bacterium]MDD7015449.1 ATP-binding protein [Bacillota bacterium]MDY4958775.1 ATP-binding protein [Lentihominibacter sp.]
MSRTIVIMGHYGSGKTEFSVNLAMSLREEYEKLALLDMDIANPYFRSRERQKQLQDEGISVIFNEYGYDIAEDLPAITAKVRAPLENPEFTTIVDVGGNDSGARIINQFRKYFVSEDTERYLVINANRFETDTPEGAMFHLEQIQEEIGLAINGLINNTHMLAETTVNDVIRGHEMCREVSRRTGIPVVWDTCNEKLLEELERTAPDFAEYNVFPIKLYMRPTWLDVKF